VADLKACKPALQSSLRSLLDKFKTVADSKWRLCRVAAAHLKSDSIIHHILGLSTHPAEHEVDEWPPDVAAAWLCDTGFGLRDNKPSFIEPPYDKALISAAKTEGLHLLAVQMPRQLQNTGPARVAQQPAQPCGFGTVKHALLPAQLLAVLRSAGIPLLIHPDKSSHIGSDEGVSYHAVKSNRT
jgi:hypothetical protein